MNSKTMTTSRSISAYKFLFNPDIALALVFALIQQLIVASSTLWIAQLSKAVATGQKFHVWLVLFSLSLFIVYIPSSLMTYFMGRGTFSAFRQYVNSFKQSFEGLTSLRTNEKLKNSSQPYLNNEAWLVIQESSRFLVTWIAIIMNVVFNILALGLFIKPVFIGAYAIAFVILIFSISTTAHAVKRSSRYAQVKRTEMMQSLLPGWDSILINNSWNTHLWDRKFQKTHHKARRGFLRSVLLVEGISGGSTMLCLIPILGILLWQIWANINNTKLLLMLVATLPRQILTIQNMSDIVLYATNWNSIHAKLSGLKSALFNPTQKNNYSGHIAWGELEAETKEQKIKLNSIESIKQFTQNYSVGRFTIRGPNGTGKSTLLAKIKENMNEDAFFLPAHSNLLFLNIDEKSLSTGTKMLAILDEVSTKIDAKVILLDEWDANLDPKNSIDVSKKIESLTCKFCIIEVRHHQDGVSKKVSCSDKKHM